jgi:Spx/MgsR family transcriptional regulator
MSHPVLHGIPNCDSVKKARAWFSAEGLAYEFHDFRKQGVDAAALADWCARLGWETVLNRKGTSWRGLDEAARAAVEDAASACQAMRAQPSLIKRPVITWPDGGLTIGLDLAEFARRSGRG